MPKTVIPQGEAALPEAGYSREEELKIRQDALEQAAEERSAQVEGGTTPLSEVKVESELAQHFDELEVQGALPGYAYAWVPNHTYGRFIQQKLAQRWEMVQGDMPEARALRGTDTTRRLGDVVLMRIGLDRKKLLDQREQYKRMQQELGISAHLQELAERAGTRIIEGDELSPEQLRRMEMMSRAKGRAGRMMDRWMRDGRIPGMAMST